MLSRRLRADPEREGRVIVSRSLAIEKAKITVPLLISALFCDLAPDRTVTISNQSKRRERDLQIGQHPVRAFEAGFEIGARPVDGRVAEPVVSSRP